MGPAGSSPDPAPGCKSEWNPAAPHLDGEHVDRAREAVQGRPENIDLVDDDHVRTRRPEAWPITRAPAGEADLVESAKEDAVEDLLEEEGRLLDACPGDPYAQRVDARCTERGRLEHEVVHRDRSEAL